MINREFKINQVTCIRVSKSLARKAFQFNLKVYICPVNLRPGFPWSPEWEMNRIGTTFDETVSSFEAFNCINAETGYYTAFYMEKWNALYFSFTDGSHHIFKSSRPETRIKVLETWSKNNSITIDCERDGFVFCTLRKKER